MILRRSAAFKKEIGTPASCNQVESLFLRTEFSALLELIKIAEGADFSWPSTTNFTDPGGMEWKAWSTPRQAP